MVAIVWHFEDLEWLAHLAKDERENDLGATGAGSVYIHHYIGIVLECLIVLVGYSDGIESHK